MQIDKLTRKELTKDFPEFQEAATKFFNHEMSVGEFKHISGKFGSYAERGAASGMLRLRCGGGTIYPHQYKFLTQAITKNNIELIHFTTSSSLQLHHLNCEQLCSLMKEAADVNIFTRGGGGDNLRNITAYALRGISTDEPFDISPYVLAAENYCLSIMTSVHFPRKLKIGFGVTNSNEVHVSFRDLGFQATPEGKFDVYSAGGLGVNPSLGLKMYEGIDPRDVLYYIQAMCDTFEEYGNFKLRNRARTRFMPIEHGEEAYRQAFDRNLQHSLAHKKLHLDTLPDTTITKTGVESLPLPLPRHIHAQKQRGLYYVNYHPIGGKPQIKVFLKLLDALSQMQDTQLRLTMNESVHIINLTASEALQIAEIISDDTASTPVETSVSCIGATVCQIGMQDSQGTLHLILDAIKPYNFPAEVLPRFHISGCQSSCGTHQIGIIGLHGAAKRINNTLVRGFDIAINGDYTLGHEVFAEPVGFLAPDQLGEFFVRLGTAVQASQLSYEQWIQTHREDFISLINSFNA